MKETSFIEQNKEKWKRFQDLAANQHSDPEEIADLYSDITDDLSYAQTFYNRRTVRVYLNQIAQGIHNLVHKERSDSFGKFFTVWKTSLPIEIYRARKHLLFALIMFVFWALLGAVTTHQNPDFPRVILGDGYVDMTNENIAKGDPLGVYHDASQVKMFFDITINNVRVAFMTFILGFFFTIGTHIFIFNNGVMLGAFQYYFHLKGVLITSFLGIWIHGAFEISSIVIAGGAGITLGNGWLFPGSYTRLQSLQLSAKRGLKIMMSLVPFLIAAGFLESFVTHNYKSLPEWSKWTLIMFSFGLIAFYYIIYPIIVARKHPELVYEQDVPTQQYQEKFNLYKLRSFGQMFADTFAFYRVHFGKIVKINLLLTLPVVLVMVVLQDIYHAEWLTHQHHFDWSKQLEVMMGFGMKGWQDVLVMLGWTYVFTVMMLSVFYGFKNQDKKLNLGSALSYIFRNLFGAWLIMLLVYIGFLLTPWYWMFLVVFLLPLFWINGAAYSLGTGSIGQRIREGFSYSARSYGNSLLSMAVIALIIFLFTQPIAFVGSIHSGFSSEPEYPDLLDMLADFVKNVSRNFTEDFMVPAMITRQIVYLIFLFVMLPFFAIMMGFIYFDIHEKNSASGLRAEFESFGKRKRNQETAIDFD